MYVLGRDDDIVSYSESSSYFAQCDGNLWTLNSCIEQSTDAGYIDFGGKFVVFVPFDAQLADRSMLSYIVEDVEHFRNIYGTGRDRWFAMVDGGLAYVEMVLSCRKCGRNGIGYDTYIVNWITDEEYDRATRTAGI